MRVLLDTNIIIHREASNIVNTEIGILFRWFDTLTIQKCIHPITVEELNKYNDSRALKSINIKIQNYHVLKSVAPFDGVVLDVSNELDTNQNDVNDSKILNEIFCGRVELLVSEDKKLHAKAKKLGIDNKVFTINEFLEKVSAENPAFADYKVLSVKKEYFGNINLKDIFFDSFREDYPGFDSWFLKKSDEVAYVCFQGAQIVAFLYIKSEGNTENYSNITPVFEGKNRLKIGTLKVVLNGFKLGERFLKIIFDNALRIKAKEIYVTIFNRNQEQLRLIELLEEWGFVYHGIKDSAAGQELVYVRQFNKVQIKSFDIPKISYPYISEDKNIFVVPIYPEYHTELFPDSILNTESPANFVESEPHRNAIEKVYICRSYERDLKPGDQIVFYRTGGRYAGVVTTIGIVESVTLNIPDADTFISICRKKSVFSDAELLQHWNYRANNRPFVVKFLYVHSYAKRPNLDWLHTNGILDIYDMPRGFKKISRADFNKIYEYSIT